ncbi:MAG TPA: hypothetical protein VGK74_13710 [Symbiobacteriaceae bacterium]
MNWRSLASVNPVLMGWLAKTVGGIAFTHVILDMIDAEGAEIAMRAAYGGEEGAIELVINPTGRAGQLLLSYITAELPGYKVQKGRLRTIPVEFRPDETPPCLVLKMIDSTIELSPKKKKKSGADSEESSTGQQAAEAKATASPAPEESGNK